MRVDVQSDARSDSNGPSGRTAPTKACDRSQRVAEPWRYIVQGEDRVQQLKACPGCGAKSFTTNAHHSHTRVIYECGTVHRIPSHGGRGDWRTTPECQSNQEDANGNA